MRAPFQVLVLPYKMHVSGIKYYIFKTQKGFWQFVSGGGEDFETAYEAAARELLEETSINKWNVLVQLSTMCFIPVCCFNKKHTKNWGGRLVIPEYAFAVDITNNSLKITNEHTEFRECLYDEAQSLLKYDSNKTALYELNETLVKKYN